MKRTRFTDEQIIGIRAWPMLRVLTCAASPCCDSGLVCRLHHRTDAPGLGFPDPGRLRGPSRPQSAPSNVDANSVIERLEKVQWLVT